MKVIEQTPTKLTLRHLPIKSWCLGGALLFTLNLLPIALVFGGAKTALNCQRTGQSQGNCQLIETPGKGTIDPTMKVQTIPLNQLLGAKIKTSHLPQEDAYTVVLLTQTGEIPFQSLRHSSTDLQAAVAQINHFIQNAGEPALTVTYRYNTASASFMITIFLFYVSFVALGLWFLVSSDSQVVTYTFDKTSGQLTVRTKGLWFNQVKEYSLENVLDVQFQELVSFKTNLVNLPGFKVEAINPRCTLVLSLGSNQSLHLPPYDASSQRSKQTLAKVIREFLGLNQ